MLPAANRGTGQCVALPDNCLSPPPPPAGPVMMMYVNMAMNAMAAVFAPNILTNMMPTLTALSIIPMTMGDEGGVFHPFIKGMALVKAGLFGHVLFNGLPVATLCAPTMQNNGNAPMGLVAAPSLTHTLVCCAPARSGLAGPSSAERLVELPSAYHHANEVAWALDSDSERPAASAAGMLTEGFGYVRLRVLSLDAPARMAGAIDSQLAQGMRSLIVDLRDNPGGDMQAFIELASDFLPSDSLLGTMVEDDGDETPMYSRGPQRYRMPVTLLVNGGTASAAELFVGALMAHDRVRVVGEPTYGKGRGAVVAPTGGKGRARSMRWRLPDGRFISEGGLCPHTTREAASQRMTGAWDG